MSVEGGSGGVGVAGAAAPVVVNEGPVRSLEGFRPMNASDITTIDIGGTIAPTQPLVIAQAEEVAVSAWEKAETIISEARKPVIEPVVLPRIEPMIVPLVIPEPNPELLLQPVVSPVLELAAKTASKPATKTVYQAAPAIFPQPVLQEEQVEEVVMEKKVEEPEDELEEEEEETEKRLFLEDEKASAVRKFEIKQAVKLAFASVKNAKLSTIAGSLVAAFLPGEHAGNRSQALAEKGPDGSYEETVEAIASSGEFSSPEQAEKRFEEIVAEKKPIKSSIEGSPVAEEDVARVFKFRAVKPPAAVEIFTKRVVKKKVQVFAGPAVTESKPETNETSLKDYPELEEVFGKAHNVDNA